MTNETVATRAGAHGGRRATLWAGLAQAGPLALAGLAANAGSLVVTVVLARLLAARGYGALNQLIGLFFVVSMPGSAVLVAVVRRMASWTAAQGEVREWAAQVRRRALLALAGAAACTVAAGPFLAPVLGRHGEVGVDGIVVAGAVWVFLCVDRGVLQVHRAYRTLAGNLLVEGGLRTVLMLAAGAAGLGIDGVAVGVLAAELATAAHARWMAGRTWPGAAEPHQDPVVEWALGGGWAGGAAGDLVRAVVALAGVAVLQNVDVIVMGREGPRTAGAYAAVSVSSKALVFLAVVVAGYLLPEAALRRRAGGHALHQLAVTLALLAGPAAVLLAVAAALPRSFLAAFFSARYARAAGAFLPLALAMTCLSVLVVLTMYLLAVGDRWIVGLLVLGAAAAVVATAAAHGVPRATALADLSVEAVLTVLAALELVRVHRRWTHRQRPAPSAVAGPVPGPAVQPVGVPSALRSAPVTQRLGGGPRR